MTQIGDNRSPKFSPDNKIAFCQRSDFSYNLYLMDIDGSNKQLIAAGSNPIWSPEGNTIAFINLKGSPQIFIADANGTNVRQLTTSYLPCWDSGFPSYGNYYPIWTPNGRNIIYQSDINDGMPEIYIMKSDGSNQHRLTYSTYRNEDPEISSDGRFILFDSNRDLNFGSEIYVMDIDGNNQYSLSKNVWDDCLPLLIKK